MWFLLPLYCSVHWLWGSPFNVAAPLLTQWRFPSQCLWWPSFPTLWERKQQGWGRGEGQDAGYPNREGPYRVRYLPTLQLRKLGSEEGHDLSKAIKSISVSTWGDRHRQKNSIAYCLRLLVPGAAICKAEENRMWKQRWGEVSPRSLRTQAHHQKPRLLGWAPQLGAKVEVGMGSGRWAAWKDRSLTILCLYDLTLIKSNFVFLFNFLCINVLFIQVI